MTNILQCKNLIQDLYDKGIRTFILCAGARNAAFIECFAKLELPDNVDVHWGFEERSASFFALGRTKQSGYGAAVFTTSGSALVETHAAIIEAFYASIPLVIVSSDRPQNLWGTGAPQTIVQKDIFASHIGPTVAWSDYDHLKKAIFPMHINCPTQEPLIDEPVSKWKLNTAKTILPKNIRTQSTYEAFKNLDLNTLLKDYETLEKPFFIVSGLSRNEAPLVDFLSSLSLPIYVESTAEFLNIKNRISAEAFDIDFIRKNFDSVIRVGGIPTHKVWRQLEDDRRVTVLNFSSLKFPGRSESHVYSIDILKDFILRLKLSYNPEVLAGLNERSLKVDKLIKKFPNSEMNFYLKLKESLIEDGETQVFLGNSLPIRMWDLSGLKNNFLVFANRGVNGIDGLLSTAYGLSYGAKVPTVAVVGDLSALYDLAAPWFYTQDKKSFNIKIVIVNNGGGQIFTPMFNNPKFTNPHNLNFKNFAALWGLKYKKVESMDDLPSLAKWPDILEINPDNEQTASVWQEIKKLRS